MPILFLAVLYDLIVICDVRRCDSRISPPEVASNAVLGFLFHWINKWLIGDVTDNISSFKQLLLVLLLWWCSREKRISLTISLFMYTFFFRYVAIDNRADHSMSRDTAQSFRLKIPLKTLSSSFNYGRLLTLCWHRALDTGRWSRVEPTSLIGWFRYEPGSDLLESTPMTFCWCWPLQGTSARRL